MLPQFVPKNFIDQALIFYLNTKASKSIRHFDALIKGPFKNSILKSQDINPVFSEVNELDKLNKINAFVQEHLFYKSDPFNGTLDYYTHPWLINYMIKNKSFGNPDTCDCDDYACYYWYLLSRVDIKSTVVTIISNPLVDLKQGTLFPHVMCVGELYSGNPDTNGNFWRFTLDTNGLHFFQYSKEEQAHPEIIDKRILDFFGSIYNTEYISFINHGYPFLIV